MKLYPLLIAPLAAMALLSASPAPAAAQDKALSERARARDANGNGVIDRSEAGGPLAGNFETIDSDNSGTLDGAEIRAFFSGGARGGGSPASTKRGTKRGLAGRAKQMDANGNGVIDRDEARGPLQSNFDTADADKSGTLDGTEIGNFFRNRGRGGRAAPRVTLDAVVRGAAAETVPIYGRLVARQMGVVASRVRGAIAEMSVQVGDRLRKGDVMARLVTDTLQAERELKAAELDEYKARVATAQVQLTLSRQELRRLERLRKSAAFSQARYEDKRQDVARFKSQLGEAAAKVKQARAELRMAEIDLRSAVIRAPFPGVVSQRHANVGTYVNVGEKVVTLINDAALEVEAEIPSSRLAGLIDGTVIEVEFEDKTPFSAAVRAVVPEENPLMRTRTVRFVADFGNNGVHPAVNQSVLLRVPTGPKRRVLSVHKDAVLQRAGRTVVYVVRDGRAKMQPVRLGDAVGGRFEVLEGLDAGDMAVVRGNERLRPGQAVRTRRDGAS